MLQATVLWLNMCQKTNFVFAKTGNKFTFVLQTNKLWEERSNLGKPEK